MIKSKTALKKKNVEPYRVAAAALQVLDIASDWNMYHTFAEGKLINNVMR